MTDPKRLAERQRMERSVLDLVAAGSPANIVNLREHTAGDPEIFNSAIQSLVDRRLLPEELGQRWRAQQARLVEAQIVAFARSGAVLDEESLLRSIQCDEPALIPRVLEALISSGALVGTAGKCYLSISEEDVTNVASSLPSTSFARAFLAEHTLVRDFANSKQETVDSAAELFCLALRKYGHVDLLPDGAYCSHKHLQHAEAHVRQQITAYRTYVDDAISCSSDIDPIVFAAAIERLVLAGELKRVADGLRPTPTFKCTTWACTKCGKGTSRIDAFDDLPLCVTCTKSSPERACITKTRALSEFRLKPHELGRLQSLERPNPHYRTAAPMQLYLLEQVRALSQAKWGSPEPYLIALTEFNEQQRLSLIDDPDRFRELTPERFQYFLADRFGAMGLCVQLTGHVYRSDGGIDLIAYPDPSKCAFPFLVAIQAAHHRTDRKS